MAFYFWEGASVRLRAAEPSDWEILFRWSEDAELMGALTDLQFPQSRERAKEWATKTAAERPRNDEYFLIIETLIDNRVVGTINSHTCDRRNGTFMYGISINEGDRRKGYASDAAIMLIRYFFMELGYQKCTVQVGVNNEASKALHEELGFQQEGHLRQMWYRDGKYQDTLMLGMTKDEYDKRHILE